jgi:hypothetical protein
LAERDADLVAQRARTSEVTASVAEIQRRLGSLAMNPKQSLDGISVSSPSRELHRRNSLRDNGETYNGGGGGGGGIGGGGGSFRERRGGYGDRNRDDYEEEDTFGGNRRGYNDRGLL